MALGVVGVCLLRARQGTAQPAPLLEATVVALPTKAWSEQFLGSAVRFDNRNPTGSASKMACVDLSNATRGSSSKFGDSGDFCQQIARCFSRHTRSVLHLAAR